MIQLHVILRINKVKWGSKFDESINIPLRI